MAPTSPSPVRGRRRVVQLVELTRETVVFSERRSALAPGHRVLVRASAPDGAVYDIDATVKRVDRDRVTPWMVVVTCAVGEATVV